MPSYSFNTSGDPRGDTVKDDSYKQLKRSKSELIEHEHWNEVKNYVVRERKRRGLDTSKVISAIPKGKITADVLNNLLINSNVDGTHTDIVMRKDIIKNDNVGINDVISRILNAGQHCVCDCNYCSCDCNFCTCNCDYSCTCNCAY